MEVSIITHAGLAGTLDLTAFAAAIPVKVDAAADKATTHHRGQRTKEHSASAGVDAK